ncbi:MAG: carbohydrate ABC transporter permease [Candidatus Avispirillum sp.]
MRLNIFKKSDKQLGIVKERRRGASLQAKKARVGWLFVAPFIFGFFLIYIPIIFGSLKYSFNEIDILSGGGYELVWVGFKNYATALGDKAFMETLANGILGLIIDIPTILLFSLFIAILLNQKMPGRTAFRAIFFIPVLLTTGLIASIDSGNLIAQNMGSSSGIDTGASAESGVSSIVSATDMQSLFSGMIVGKELATYVADMVNKIFDIVNRSGVQMLIFLAGLQGISPSIYESCEIEGASPWETFWKITLPMISPMILVNAVYTVIDSFTSGNNKVMTYINNLYNQAGDSNVISSAMAWMYFLLVMLIVAAVAGIISSVVFYNRKD